VPVAIQSWQPFHSPTLKCTFVPGTASDPTHPFILYSLFPTPYEQPHAKQKAYIYSPKDSLIRGVVNEETTRLETTIKRIVERRASNSDADNSDHSSASASHPGKSPSFPMDISEGGKNSNSSYIHDRDEDSVGVDVRRNTSFTNQYDHPSPSMESGTNSASDSSSNLDTRVHLVEITPEKNHTFQSVQQRKRKRKEVESPQEQQQQVPRLSSSHSGNNFHPSPQQLPRQPSMMHVQHQQQHQFNHMSDDQGNLNREFLTMGRPSSPFVGLFKSSNPSNPFSMHGNPPIGPHPMAQTGTHKSGGQRMSTNNCDPAQSNYSDDTFNPHDLANFMGHQMTTMDHNPNFSQQRSFPWSGQNDSPMMQKLDTHFSQQQPRPDSKTTHHQSFHPSIRSPSSSSSMNSALPHNSPTSQQNRQQQARSQDVYSQFWNHRYGSSGVKQDGQTLDYDNLQDMTSNSDLNQITSTGSAQASDSDSSASNSSMVRFFNSK